MMSAASGFLGVRAVLGRAALSSRPKKTKFAAAKASIAPPPPSGGADTSDSKESSAAEDAPRRAKVSMVSLGCPKNTVDGEVMLGDLFANGFDVIDEHEDADAVAAAEQTRHQASADVARGSEHHHAHLFGRSVAVVVAEGHRRWLHGAQAKNWRSGRN